MCRRQDLPFIPTWLTVAVLCEAVDLIHQVQGCPVTGSFEDGNESSGSIKCGGFLGQLRNCQLRKLDLALLSYLELVGTGRMLVLLK
jgi:hypothetical protein